MDTYVRVAPSRKLHRVLKDPHPHIVVESRKELHGWYPGRRECTGERMLINPYNGCRNDCFCCYAKALPGYFQLFRKKGVVTVFRDFDRSISTQLDSLNVASCGYLSPVTDPFQSINAAYGLSERIIRVFVERNVPIEFITKCRVPDQVLELMEGQHHSFCQFSLFTDREELRQALMKEGATTDELFWEMARCRRVGLPVVCRIDPIVPGVTDAKRDLERIVRRAQGSGAHHVIASVMDVPLQIKGDIFGHLRRMFGHGLGYDLERLYVEKIGGSLHARIDYRKRLFDFLRNCCERIGTGFALCMEYELVEGMPVGLNGEFMNTHNCEGIDIPVYVREDSIFKPAADCQGACLHCNRPDCGIDDLAMASSPDKKKSFSLGDYRRWSRELAALDC